MTLHITGCVFHYVAYLHDFGSDTWVALAELENTGNFERYGDISPAIGIFVSFRSVLI